MHQLPFSGTYEYNYTFYRVGYDLLHNGLLRLAQLLFLKCPFLFVTPLISVPYQCYYFSIRSFLLLLERLFLFAAVLAYLCKIIICKEAA